MSFLDSLFSASPQPDLTQNVGNFAPPNLAQQMASTNTQSTLSGLQTPPGLTSQNALTQDVGNFANSPTQSVSPSNSGGGSPPAPASGLSPMNNFWQTMTHGGGDGKLTNDEMKQLGAINTSLATEQDPELRKQLQAQHQSLLSNAQDRGGVFGMLGRIATGQTIGNTEGMLHAGLSMAMPIVNSYIMKKRMQDAGNAVLQNQNHVRANQQQWVNSQYVK